MTFELINICAKLTPVFTNSNNEGNLRFHLGNNSEQILSFESSFLLTLKQLTQPITLTASVLLFIVELIRDRVGSHSPEQSSSWTSCYLCSYGLLIHVWS